MKIFPPTSTRVEGNTNKELNLRIARRTAANVAEAAAGGRAAISGRLRKLDEEWDIERVLETNASLAVLVSVGLGFSVNRKWFGLAGVVAGFLFQHALQGWCPPIPLFRRLGVRTEKEISQERLALRVLRGDLQPVGTPSDALGQAEIKVA